MAQIPSISGREFSKFVESPTRPGESAVEIFGSVSVGANPFSPPAGTVKVAATIGSLVEVYEYKDNLDVTLKTITLTYATIAKDGDFVAEVS